MSATSNRDPKLPWSTRTTNLAHFLTRNAARLGDRPAIIWDDLTITWGQLDARVSALSAAMQDRFGVQHGDRILVQSPNNNQITEIMLACWRVGAVWVPSNFRQRADEVAYLGKKADVSLMFCEQDFAGHATACTEAAPKLEHVVCIGRGFGTEYEALIADYMGQDVMNADVDRDDPCWLFFTSGSTGRPKAVVLTHGQLGFVTLNHLNDLMPSTTPDDVSLVVAPLSHGAGMHQLVQIAAGAASVLVPAGKFDPEAAWELVQRYKVTNMFTVPTIVKMLTEHPAVDAYDHSSLRYVIYAGAPMYREDQKHALRKLGHVLVQYFGLGEVTGAITVLPRHDHHIEDGPEARVGTCGIERTGLHVSIQGDDGQILGPHETGEICVAGPAVCAGYYMDDGANEKAFRDGWFRTGDLGHLDEQRYLYITGRASDMYISGGSNVYPREIEELLLTHPAVSEVAILGCPHRTWGEVGLAICVLEAGHDVDEAELNALLAAKLAKYKLPSQYIYLPEMPKTGYGKVTKKLVREELEAQGLWPGELS
ncbi:acyl-CoA synthetase [Donghicola sp.]|jgi:acyl-CoA synthetase (AMP-forming)/AMP-acid ligase II|uniref:acyl-CoA synthetase n=1 Tax=Donghicola sp. TaxID=1929294 RepID=UPI0025F04EC2|nr:acyl-CoA synthetase [Donghicola sp.]MCT4578663.1 acyl-CoA synthetase [Donghicola sp.]